MNINLSLSPATSIANKILVVIYKSSASLVPFDHREIDPPHDTPTEVTFEDVPPVVFIVNTYESTGYPVLGALLHSFIYDPTFSGVEIRLPLFIEMAAPYVGTNDYTNATLTGWVISNIERVSQGTQFFDIDIQLHAPVQDGWMLLATGDVFADHEKWVVFFAPNITVASPIYNSPKVINGTRIISVDTVLTEADQGTLIQLQGAGSFFTVTLPDLDLIDTFIPFFFNSNAGNHVNVSVKAKTGQFIEGQTEVLLGMKEVLWLINDTGGWVIVSTNLKYLEGVVVDDYLIGYNSILKTPSRLNMVFADGTLYDRSVYKRLFNAFNKLEASEKVSDADWLLETVDPTTGKPRNNKGKWSFGDGATTFRVPRIYAAGYFRAIDGTTRLPGDFKNETVGNHQHESNDYTGGGARFGTGGAYNGLGTFYGLLNGFAALVSNVYRTSTVPAGKTEPDNYGIYKSIFS